MNQAPVTVRKVRSVMPPIKLYPNGHPGRYFAKCDDALVVQGVIGGRVIQMRNAAITVEEADIPQLKAAGYEVSIVEAQV